MIIDSSALIYILNDELYSKKYRKELHQNRGELHISAWTISEVGIITNKLANSGAQLLDELIAHLRVNIISFTHQHAILAIQAYQQFGKGKHPARLNIGDCTTYSLAKMQNQPILCTGNDFRLTDIATIQFDLL